MLSLTYVEDQMMFFNEKGAFNCPSSLNNQFVYFYTRNFFIIMGEEMWNVDDCDFFVLEYECNLFLKHISCGSHWWI
jgi:hypothetical protein